MTIHPKIPSHCGCACPGCTFLDVYPVMPSLDPPDVNDLGNGDWQVWCNTLGPLIDGKATLIKRLFRTDGTSTPKFVWPILGHPFSMPLLAYSLPHDGDYAAELYPREECDYRYLQGMTQDGRINLVKRNAIWSGVRAGGWNVWRKHTDKSIETARQFCSVVYEEEYYALRSARHLSLSPLTSNL